MSQSIKKMEHKLIKHSDGKSIFYFLLLTNMSKHYKTTNSEYKHTNTK